MRRIFKLLVASGLIAGLWILVRQLLEGDGRARQGSGGVAESVEGAAKSAAGSVKAAGEAIREQASSVSHGSNNDAGEPSKAELYKQAKRLDVEGRSKMSKEELARAVAEARGRDQ